MKKVRISRVLGIALVCLIIGLTHVAALGTASAATFGIGDTVEVTTNLNVRTGPGTGYPEITDPDYPGYAPTGTIGIILSGPSSADGYIWWEVDFGPGLYSGWSAQDYLDKVTPCPHSCWDRSPLSNDELANVVRSNFPLGAVTQTGESVRVTAYAVAKAESGGNPSACGDNDKSIGLWQINIDYHPQYDKCRLFEQDYNANAAKEISNSGKDWNPWCTWEKTACGGNGDESYKNYLVQARKHFYPKVTSVSVSQSSISLGEAVKIYYSVSDDVGLARVELWRTTDENGSPDDSNWQEVKQVSVSGITYSDYLTDTPTSPGIYWYGIHVADNSGAPEAWNDEKNSRTGGLPGVFGPIEVTVSQPTYPPEVTTTGESSITTSSAALWGNLDSTGGLDCQVWFKYGTSASYGSSTTPLSMSTTAPFGAIISSLSPDTTYHFRACASNSKGTRYGSDMTFTTTPDEVVTFPDPNLKAAIREAIGKPTGDIYQSDLVGLVELSAQNRGINNLTGLEYCTELNVLNLGGNSIANISPLSGLTNLTDLILFSNRIDNISMLSNLTNLNFLDIGYNQVSDIYPLSNLIRLTRLKIYLNPISDITPVSNLTNLTIFHAGQIRILSDITPLANLTNLMGLQLGSCQISDISPLAGLTNLNALYLQNNQISDISILSDFTSLYYLDISHNQISDISILSDFTSLYYLDISYNQISDISILSDFTSLYDLDISYNQISDIEPLVSNQGISEGDLVDLSFNPLNTVSVDTYIPQLEQRGVTVFYDILELNPDFEVDKRRVAVGEFVTFTNLTRGGMIPYTKAEWDFDGDGDIDITCEKNDPSNPEPMDTVHWAYTESGIYDVKLYMTDSAPTTVWQEQYDYITVEPPPIVSSVSPEDGATDVPIDTVVAVNFSEAMDESTIDETTFTLEGSTVSGTVGYDPATYTATFTPNANLDYGHPYTATLTKDITDEAGNPLEGDYSWSFSTEVEASPANIFVPDDYPTIQAAVVGASPGDTIIVRDGTYTENVDVDKSVTIRSEGGADSTIVQAASPDDHVFEVMADYINIQGFTVKGATGSDKAGIYLDNVDHCQISNNIILNNKHGIHLNNSSYNDIHDNTVKLCSGSGIFLDHSPIPGPYLPPVGRNNPGIIIGENEFKWENESLAYDGNTDTFAEVWTFDWHSSPWLELFAPPKPSQGIRFWLGPWVNYGIHPRVELFYDGDWHFLTEWLYGRWRVLDEYREAAIVPKGEWIEIDYPEQMVEKARIMYHPNTLGNRGYAQLHEFQFKTTLGISSSNNDIVQNNISNNGAAVRLYHSSDNRIYLNNFINNTDNGYSEDSSYICNSPEEITYNYNGNTYTGHLGNYWSNYAAYLPPVGRNNPGIIIGENEFKWENESLAYDGNTDTFAEVWTFDWHSSPWLELFAPPKPSQGIRFWLGPWVNYGIHPRVELFYDGDWHFLTEWRDGRWRVLDEYREAAIVPKGEWIEIDYPEQMVEKARIMFGPNVIGSRGYAQLHEFQFKTASSDADGDGIWDTPYSIDRDKDSYPLTEPFENYQIGGGPGENQPPTASASEISGQPETMHPYNTYSVTAQYHDPDGRDNLKYCYLRLNQPSKPLTMMWDQSNGNYRPWAGEEGEDYMLVTSVISTELADGYELSWSFELKSSWPGTDSPIDFGVYAWDDGDLKSGWDYDDTNAAFIVQPFLPVLISPLSITPEKETYEIGETLTAQFTIRNQGAMPFTLDVLTAGGRCNGWCLPSGCPDFPHRSVTLQPDETYRYEGDFTLPRSGNYLFFVAYYIDSPTPDEAKLLDENNWSTNIDLGTGLTPADRIRTIIMPQTEEEADLSAKINKLLAIKVQYLPYLLDPEGFQMSVAIVWMNWTSWITEVELNEKYDELYFTGIDYDCASRKALTNAKAALNRGDIEIAQEYIQDYFLYNRLSLMSFNAATNFFLDMAGAGETLAEGVRDGCQSAVKFGLIFVSPAAAKAADYLYIGSDFVVDYYFRGEDEALKDALVEAVITALFNEIPLAPGGRTLEDYIANRVGEVTFPLLQTWIKSGQWQFFLSRSLKYGAEWLSEEVAGEVASLILDELGKSVDSIKSQLKSPAELLVYDSQGNATGLFNGQIEHGIPRSMYDNEAVTIFFPSGPYTYYVIGKDEGTYGLEVSYDEGGNTANFNAIDIPTLLGAKHEFTIDWDALSQGEEGVTLEIDADGDGVFEDTFTSDDELTGGEFILQTATTVDFDPDTLNLKSKGKYVTVYIELPPDYDVGQIDVSSVMLNEVVPALTKPTEVGDYDGDGIPDLMVKFDRAAVQEILQVGEQVEVTITGKAAGVTFQGADTIRVLR